jgi:hypothetical protein
LHSAKSYFRTECSECSSLYFVRVTICKASWKKHWIMNLWGFVVH